MLTLFGHKAPDTDSTGSPLIWAWYLNEVRGIPARAVLLGRPNTEAEFVLKRWGFATPEIIEDIEPGQKVIILDTNNPAELPTSIDKAEIVAIIDHHKLSGGLSTRQPIEVTIRPLACTATILHQLMGADAAKMPERIKCLMLSCILSDTLEFRSPTTTDVDRALALELARELGISIPDYAAELFAAKSDVSAFADADLLRMDSKSYKVGDKMLMVSVLETTAPHVVLARKEGLLAAMPAVAAAEGADAVLLFIVDILREQATLLIPNPLVKTIAEKSFGCTVTGDEVVLPGILSRKKQIVPALKV